MKTIILKSIRLTHFKGVHSFECNFDEKLTTISGRNGLGKSTIFDAFTYLLFGKDSHGNTSFGIKTVDESGNVIPKLPHEVSASLLVDGQETNLCRRYNEKWVKRRGSAEEELQGNTEEYFINDVPLKKSEYQARVSEICDEQLFKLVTSPTHFTSLPWKDQRTILFSMAGDISNEELAGDNQEFVELLKNITGKSLEDFKKEIAAKKKKIKAEIDALPARIDECHRMMPEADDWKELEKQIADGKKRIEEIDNILTDISAAQNEKADKRRKMLDEQSALYNKRMELMRRMKDEANKGYFEAAKKRQELNTKLFSLEDEIKQTERKRDNLAEQRTECQQKREKLVAEYREVASRKLELDESNFQCPTCHRSFEPEKIEEMRTSMTSEFNEKKANDLKANTEKGMANKKVMEELEPQIQELTDKVLELTKEYEALKANPIFKENTSMPDLTEQVAEVENSEEYKAMLKQEQDLQVEIDKPLANEEDETYKTSLKTERTDLQEHGDQLKHLLMRREQIADLKKRITELEEQLQTQSQALADLERTEFTIEQFSMARIDALTAKVDAMFSMVKFKLFNEQFNGGIAECCEAMVNGVRLSDVNSAHKILAGLDIIATISKHNGVSATIFVDNAETVNTLPEMPCQMIALRVTEDNKLTIK